MKIIAPRLPALLPVEDDMFWSVTMGLFTPAFLDGARALLIQNDEESE